MKIVALAECCEFIKDGVHNTPEKISQGIPVLSAGNVYGGHLSFETNRFATEEDLTIFRKRLHPKVGDVLLTIVGTIGRVAVLTEDKPLIFQRSVCVLRPKPELLDSLYFRYALESEFVQKQFDKEQQGVAQMGIYLETLNEIKVPLPPLTEQKRIASLLARADRLRQLRRTAHDLGDALLQSVFLEMFGDGSKFEKVEFEEILEENPKNGLYLSSDEYGSGTPIIRIDAFYDGVLGNPIYFKRLRATPKQIEEFNVQNDEILINRVNSLEYLGKCALVKGLLEPTLFESNMMRIRINRKLAHPVYVTKYLTTAQAYAQIMQRAKKAVNQASINQQDVKSIVIPIPPLSLQEEFAGVVARVEGLRGRMAESTRQVDGLFESLLHDAFE